MPPNTDIKNFLKGLPIFSSVEEPAFNWFIANSTIKQYNKDDFLFQPHDPVNELIIILEGVIDIYTEGTNGRRSLFLYKKGDIAGNLPFSRVKEANGYGKVIEELTVISLHKDYFTEMVNVSYALTQALVAVMSDRIRDTSQNTFQDEKLKALGKISAGLAHELNNPASAMVRSADVLYEKLSETPENFKAVMQLNINETQTNEGNKLIFDKIDAHNKSPKDFTLLERQDRVDDLTDWMEERAVKNADAIADTLTEFDFMESDLEELAVILRETAKLSTVLNWFDNRLSVELLVVEIKEASSRVANLVHSVKKYSHMDEGNGKRMANIQEGIRTTLNILVHQLKQKQIKVDKQFSKDFPRIFANPSELNQVWTNLLSNAIDALPRRGLITLRTYKEYDYACVGITDNGSGIPVDIINRIWEPFFTTKKVGEGTGMGLDMVKKIIQRNRGFIEVDSQPGQTTFTIKFLSEKH